MKNRFYKDCGAHKYIECHNKRKRPLHYKINRKIAYYDNDVIPKAGFDSEYGHNKKQHNFNDDMCFDSMKDRN